MTIFGAGEYAMRLWVRPDQLATMQITIPEIIDAIKQQNTVNPAGQIGGEPIPPGQQFTYTVRAQGRLTDEKQFGDIVVRANVDGSIVRMKDVARIEMGAQSYSTIGRLNGALDLLDFRVVRRPAHLPPAIDQTKDLVQAIGKNARPMKQFLVERS